MNSSEAKRLVLIGTVGTSVLTVATTFRRGKTPSYRIAVGALVVGTILAAGAEVQPKLAASFAMLMLTTAAFVVGGDAWDAIGGVPIGRAVTGGAALAAEQGMEK
jgi:hypothetical protein